MNGELATGERYMDLFGVLVVATVTAFDDRGNLTQFSAGDFIDFCLEFGIRPIR